MQCKKEKSEFDEYFCLVWLSDTKLYNAAVGLFNEAVLLSSVFWLECCLLCCTIWFPFFESVYEIV